MGGLDLIEYTMKIEDAFNLRIPDEDAQHLLTVGAMYDYLLRRLPQMPPQEIWDKQLDLLARFRRLSEEEKRRIKPDHHFLQDLNFD